MKGGEETILGSLPRRRRSLVLQVNVPAVKDSFPQSTVVDSSSPESGQNMVNDGLRSVTDGVKDDG